MSGTLASVRPKATVLYLLPAIFYFFKPFFRRKRLFFAESNRYRSSFCCFSPKATVIGQVSIAFRGKQPLFVRF